MTYDHCHDHCRMWLDLEIRVTKLEQDRINKRFAARLDKEAGEVRQTLNERFATIETLLVRMDAKLSDDRST